MFLINIFKLFICEHVCHILLFITFIGAYLMQTIYTFYLSRCAIVLLIYVNLFRFCHVVSVPD